MNKSKLNFKMNVNGKQRIEYLLPDNVTVSFIIQAEEKPLVFRPGRQKKEIRTIIKAKRKNPNGTVEPLKLDKGGYELLYEEAISDEQVKEAIENLNKIIPELNN